MELDDLVENLAFGKNTPKVFSTLGMYLSPETIYIAQSKLDKTGKPVVDHLVRIPVPVPDKNKAAAATGTLNTGFLTDNNKLAGLIQQSMSQFHWNSKQVMVTLSHHLGLLRYFTMPAVDRRFWKSAVPVEAKKYIPIPFDALSYDYQCIALPPDAGNRARQGSLVAVTQKQNLFNIAKMLEGLGLSTAGMEVAPCSVLKLWQALDKSALGGPYCQVHFDGGSVRILVADRGLPVFFREVFLGPEADLADQRKLDLGGCLTFAQKQLAVSAVTQISISGATPNLPAWKEALSKEVSLPVAIQDTAGMMGIKAGDWGGYSAIGASLRFQISSALTLDLGAIGRVTEEEKRVALDLMVAGAALGVLLMVLGVYYFAAYQLRARQLKVYKRDTATEMIFHNKAANAVDEMFKKMRLQSEMTSVVYTGGQNKLTSIFKDIVDNLPEKAWITRMSITRPAGKATGEAAGLTISGNAVAEDMAHEQDMGFQFKERLSKSPVLAKMFPALQVTVNSIPTMGEPMGGALDPGSFTTKQESRTSFLLTGSSKVR